MGTKTVRFMDGAQREMTVAEAEEADCRWRALLAGGARAVVAFDIYRRLGMPARSALRQVRWQVDQGGWR